jgi:formate dehydrogenase maturation protein FdhE
MRVGDYIDDYCSRCHRSMDHSVVSVKADEADRVRCRTCDYEHPYRKNRGGKREMSAKEAFDQVLASVMGSLPNPEPSPKRKRK